MSQTAPNNPIQIPIRLTIFHFVLNTNMAITNVNKGTSAFRMPIYELSKTVCALVNKKAGIPFPNIATTNKGTHSF